MINEAQKTVCLTALGVMLCGCQTENSNIKADFADSSAVIENAVAYAQSEQIVADAHKKGLDVQPPGGRFSSNDLILDELQYSLFDDTVDVQFLLHPKLRAHKDDTSPSPICEYDSDLITVKVDRAGQCRIASTGQSSFSSTESPLRTQSAQALWRAVELANRGIAKGRVMISSSDIDNAIGNPPFKTETTVDCEQVATSVEGVIKRRIPKRLHPRDVRLLSVGRSDSPNTVNVAFCILPSIVRKSHDQAECLAIKISVTQQDISNAPVVFWLSGINHAPLDIELSTANQCDDEDLFETVFRTMFTRDMSPSEDVKIRFISAPCGHQLTDQFFKRFDGDKIPVASPYTQIPGFKGLWANDRYVPNIDGNISYQISEIRPFDVNNFFISCQVTRGCLAASGYIYTVQKVKGKWKVVRCELTWFS